MKRHSDPMPLPTTPWSRSRAHEVLAAAAAGKVNVSRHMNRLSLAHAAVCLWEPHLV